MSDHMKVWPEGKSCGVMASVNLGAELYGRIFHPDMDVDDGDIIRLGKIGVEYGLPRLLDTLERFSVKATFFIPGAVGERYPEQVKEIARRGHEVGCHGDQHEILGCLSRAQQGTVLQRVGRKLEVLIGRQIKGFRIPEGEMNEDTLMALKELGYGHNSSFSDNDVSYIHGCTGLVELPIHQELLDFSYLTFTSDPPIPPGQARPASMDEALKNWIYGREGARRQGTFMNTQLDPQTIGEQGRIFVLEELLSRIQKEPGAWIATGEMIASHMRMI